MPEYNIPALYNLLFLAATFTVPTSVSKEYLQRTQNKMVKFSFYE